MLGAFLLIGFLVVWWLGGSLWVVFAAIVIAYLLEALVQRLTRRGVPRLISVMLVFTLFMAGLIAALFGLVPMLIRQLTALVQAIPNYITRGQEVLAELPERYPQLISRNQVELVTAQIGEEVAMHGQALLGWSLASVAGLVSLLVLLILIPILVFFFLKDKHEIQAWFQRQLPGDLQLVRSVWSEVDLQIGNYARGKVLEILLVGAVSWVTFVLLGLPYAALLATITGFSVLIPYIGAAVVTVPVALVALFHWGWSWEFWQVVIAYAIIQFLDGNVLVPLLFSEVVNLHPVAIIVAILVFGGLWGFWGVFFAIPLATLVQAVLRAWPRDDKAADPPEPAG